MDNIDIDFLRKNEDIMVETVLNHYSMGRTRSLDVNYHPPRVHRIQVKYGDMRINLHKIFPCAPEDALLHPHPWTSGMIVHSDGEYVMGIGHSSGNDPSEVKIDCTLSMTGKFYYAMTEKDSWHYVAPRVLPAYSIMITHKTWDRWSPKPEGVLMELEHDYQEEIISFFRKKYKL